MAGEVLVDEGAVEADGLEDLRAAVALQRRDAHLRHHLQHALVQRLDVAQHRLVVGHAGQQPLAQQVVQALEGEIRVDRAGAVAHEQRDVVHFAGVARLDQQAALGAGALAHQVMVHAGGRQQAGDRRVRGVDAAVGQDQDAVAGRRPPG